MIKNIIAILVKINWVLFIHQPSNISFLFGHLSLDNTGQCLGMITGSVLRFSGPFQVSHMQGQDLPLCCHSGLADIYIAYIYIYIVDIRFVSIISLPINQT